MTPQDIVRIVEEFFKAIIRVLVALGVMEEETTAAPDATTGA